MTIRRKGGIGTQKRRIIFSALMTAIMLLNACSKQSPGEKIYAAPEPVAERSISAYGVISPGGIRNITIDFPATVMDLKVHEGQRVVKGDLLVVLDTSVYFSQIRSKENDLAAARIEAQRALADGTKDDYDVRLMIANVSKLEGELDAMRAALDRNYLTANGIVSDVDDGLVSEITCHRGDQIVPGAKILTIMDMKDIVVKAHIPEQFFADVTVGSIANIVPLMNRDMKFSGKVSRIIGLATDKMGETVVPIEITFDKYDPILLPGFNVDVEILLE